MFTAVIGPTNNCDDLNFVSHHFYTVLPQAGACTMLIFTMLVWEEVVGAVNTFGSDFLREMPRDCANEVRICKGITWYYCVLSDNH